MPEEEKKKHNPGILDWIADFLVTPIKTSISGLLQPIIGHPDVKERADLENKVAALKEAMVSGIPHSSPHSPELTPDSAKESLEDWARKGHSDSVSAWLASIAAESASLGFVDISVCGYLSLPMTRAYFDLITEIAKAEWEIGRIPYLQRYWNREYTPQIPGYQDMISIYVREGYLAEKWVEIPEEFASFMKELGYSEDWTKRLWGQHWVLPSVGLLYEMFHKKIIDRPTMVQMLKYHDFEPVWRGRLIENAWSLIPRVDLRRGYAWGIISSEQLQERYEKLGFNPEDARSMTGIAKRYGLTAYYSRLLSVASATFRKGQLSGQDFQRIMEVCGLPWEAQDLLLRAESMARDAAVTELGEEPRTLSASQICAAYTKGLLSLSAAREQLLGMGYLEGDADLLLALAAPKPASEAPTTEIVSAASLLYKNGWMSPEEFTGWLRKARLTDEEIAVVKDAQDLRYWFDYASDLLALWKQMYAKDIISLDEFYQSLVRWGCQPDRAWAIVSLEETRKIPKPRVAG